MATATDRGKEVGVQNCEPTNRNSIHSERSGERLPSRQQRSGNADGPGKVAQHTDTHGSGSEVNAEGAQLQFAFLSGEIPPAQAGREVSRWHSTPQAAGEPTEGRRAAACGGNKAKRSGNA